jgi:hypothetical protein
VEIGKVARLDEIGSGATPKAKITELGQPILIEYVWGRQIGENTINP